MIISNKDVQCHLFKIYLEQLGDPKGIPIIFLHGGPGSGFQHSHKLLFNQKHIRLIMFDQRGAGKSLPKRCLISNTTNHLVSDMEFIRKRLFHRCVKNTLIFKHVLQQSYLVKIVRG